MSDVTRRGAFALFGGAVAALFGAPAVASPIPINRLPVYRPIYGELQHFVSNGVGVTRIYDGKRWLRFAGEEGQAVFHRVGGP